MINFFNKLKSTYYSLKSKLQPRFFACILILILVIIYLLSIFIFFGLDIFNWVRSSRTLMKSFEIFFLSCFVISAILIIIFRKQNRTEDVESEIDGEIYPEPTFSSTITMLLIFILIYVPIVIVSIPALASNNYQWLIPALVFGFLSLFVALALILPNVPRPLLYYQKRLDFIFVVSIAVFAIFTGVWLWETKTNIITLSYGNELIPIYILGGLLGLMFLLEIIGTRETLQFLTASRKVRLGEQSLMFATAIFIAIISIPNFFLGGAIQSSFSAILVTFCGLIVVVANSWGIRLATISVCITIYIISALFPQVKVNSELILLNESSINYEEYRSFQVNDIDAHKDFQMSWVFLSLIVTLALSSRVSFNIFGSGSHVTIFAEDGAEKKELCDFLNSEEMQIDHAIYTNLGQNLTNQTVQKKFLSEASYAIFVLPDGKIHDKALIDLGCCVAKLGYERVCIVCQNWVDLPAPYCDNVTCVRLNGQNWQLPLVFELKEAGAA